MVSVTNKVIRRYGNNATKKIYDRDAGFLLHLSMFAKQADETGRMYHAIGKPGGWWWALADHERVLVRMRRGALKWSLAEVGMIMKGA